MPADKIRGMSTQEIADTFEVSYETAERQQTKVQKSDSELRQEIIKQAKLSIRKNTIKIATLRIRIFIGICHDSIVWILLIFASILLIY